MTARPARRPRRADRPGPGRLTAGPGPGPAYLVAETEVTAMSELPGASQQPADHPGQPSPHRPAGSKAHDRPRLPRRVQRTAEWGKTKYAGSSAESLWTRLDSVDFINQGMLFAATLLLCFVPFVIVAAALAGQSVVSAMSWRLGLSRPAAADVGHLFASSATTTDAVVGTTSVVFFVLGGLAAATALQALYERVFELDRRGMTDIWRRLIVVAVTVGWGALGSAMGPGLRASSPVLWWIVNLPAFIGFWWLAMWILVGGRVSWRRLFPCACATGAFWLGMLTAFSLFFSGMVISDYDKYGPIGVIFALMAFLIAIGVVIILGAVVGLVWQERGLSWAAAFRKLRRAS